MAAARSSFLTSSCCSLLASHYTFWKWPWVSSPAMDPSRSGRSSPFLKVNKFERITISFKTNKKKGPYGQFTCLWLIVSLTTCLMTSLTHLQLTRILILKQPYLFYYGDFKTEVIQVVTSFLRKKTTGKDDAIYLWSRD